MSALRLREPRAAILMYHRLSDEIFDPEEARYTISPAAFREQMASLAADGRPVLSVDALLERDFADGAVVLTFDDGCASDASTALPVLESHGFPAAFFVSPAKVGRSGFLSWDDLETLRDSGMHIGSHGLDHRLFDDMEAKELERQLSESKRWLEDRLGSRVTTIALPGGSGGRRAPAVARRLGYRSVLGSFPALARPAHASTLLPRFAVRRTDSVARVRALIRQEPLPLARARARYLLLRGIKSVVSRRVFDRASRAIGSETGGSR